MDAFLAISRSIKEWIGQVLSTIAAIAMIVFTLFALLEIVRRYVFSVVFDWGQDAMIIGMVCTVAIYFCVTQVRRSHLVMNAIVQLLHSRGHYKAVGALKILASLAIVSFCASIGITGWPTVTYAWDRALMSESLVLPLWPAYATLMASFLLMALIAFLQLIEDIISFARKEYLDADIELTTDV